MSYVEDLRDRS